ncbi:nucleoside hydrolase [Paenibacillus sp. ACRRX]|uniref:nucleoside hydrolase n=1 Tax=Paenibacillus sp. ACRRX TaxID=2918206 RepID=UPI001EF4E584|nr:nucleoside hydrolase [Paenibacillus sp. ACRRX]MCG7406107.1 nucleoside hydrolase [Paenibacillus sp. ACRRX]
MDLGAKLLILDVDTGVDDALAIAYAVRSPELKLHGITTCYGNVTVSEAARNTLIVLEKLGVYDVPVFKGAEQPLKRKKEHYVRHIHGEHGLGEAELFEPQNKPSGKNAVDYLIEQFRAYPKQITLVMVGPLTNLALALQKAPDIAELIGELIIMGGAVRTRGNVTSHAEANIHCDVDAADILFKAKLPLTVVGLDVTMETLLPLSAVQQWRNENPDIGGYFADITEFYIRFYETRYPCSGGCALHDPLAVGVAIDASFVKRVPLHVAIDKTGDEIGRTRELDDGEATCEVCVEVDAERFLTHFLSRVI